MKAVIIVWLMFLTGCANTVHKENQKIHITTQANHPKVNRALHSVYSKKYIYDYISAFDKNQYVVEWKHQAEYDYSRLEAAISQCRVYQIEELTKRGDIESLEDMAKYEYRLFVSCMDNRGFELIDSWRHTPESLSVRLAKSYEAYGERLDVSGVIVVKGDHLSYLEIKPRIDECHALIVEQSSFNQGDAGSMIYVDITPALERFEKCLIDAGYDVEILD